MVISEEAKHHNFKRSAFRLSALLGISSILVAGVLAIDPPSSSNAQNEIISGSETAETSLTSSDFLTKTKTIKTESINSQINWEELKTQDGISVFSRGGDKEFPSSIGRIIKPNVNPDAFVNALRTMGKKFGGSDRVEAFLKNPGLHIDLQFADVFPSGDYRSSIIYYPQRIVNNYIEGAEYYKKTQQYSPLASSKDAPEATIYHELFHQYQDVVNKEIMDQTEIDKRNIVIGCLVIGLIGGFILARIPGVIVGVIAGGLVGYLLLAPTTNSAEDQVLPKVGIILQDPAFVQYRGQFFTY
jgi:hypothetical protein